MSKRALFEKRFYSESFQSEWRTYKKLFGEDLDDLFGEDFEHKNQLHSICQHLVAGRFDQAYRGLRSVEEYCADEKDRLILNRLIAICLNREEMDRVQVGDWIKKNVGTVTLYYRVVRQTAEGMIIKQGFHKSISVDICPNNGKPFFYEMTNLNCFQFPDEQETAAMRDYYNEHPDEAERFERQTDTMIAYRQAALDRGLRETAPLNLGHTASTSLPTSDDARKIVPLHFYRVMSDRVAFILNVSDMGDSIRVVYGFTEIPDVESVAAHKHMDHEIRLRHVAVIRTKEDEIAAEETIRRIFEAYQNTSAEQLSALNAEREKAVFGRIDDHLSRIGLRQEDLTPGSARILLDPLQLIDRRPQGILWRKALDQGVEVIFMANKSDPQDLYILGIYLHRDGVSRSHCFRAFLPNDTYSTVDLQLLTEQELETLLDCAIETYLRPILQNPLSILSEDPMIRSGCNCKRRECKDCWLQKDTSEE